MALASLMRIAEDAKAKAKADALQKIATSREPEFRKYLLCECIEAYLPLEGVQMSEYENLLITPSYQGARKYGKTSFELGHAEGERKVLREQLTIRFGKLSEEVSKRLESCTDAELLGLAKKILSASSLLELGLES